MIDVDNLSEKELATCVDEFVKRAINHARNTGYNKHLYVAISASQYSPDQEYTIEHSAAVGEYSKEHKSSTNNLVQSVDNAVSRWLADQLNAPTTVRPMIEHKLDIGVSDDIPF